MTWPTCVRVLLASRGVAVCVGGVLCLGGLGRRCSAMASYFADRRLLLGAAVAAYAGMRLLLLVWIWIT